MDTIKLILPSEEYLDQVWAYRQECHKADSSMDGCGSLRTMEAAAWLGQVEQLSRPETTPEGWVPSTQFLYIRESDGRLVGMIQIRDTLRELLNEEKSNGDESRMTVLRARLNSQYDAFVKKYGHLNSQTNRGLMRDDPEHSLLESLEADYDKGLSPETARKHGGAARPT